jgi:hypothetical protein
MRRFATLGGLLPFSLNHLEQRPTAWHWLKSRFRLWFDKPEPPPQTVPDKSFRFPAHHEWRLEAARP